MPSSPPSHRSRRPSLFLLFATLSIAPWALSATHSLFGHRTPKPSPNNPAKAPRGVVVGYFPQWGAYTNYFPRNLLLSGGAAQLDQINYAQGFVTNGHCSVADPHADLDLTFTAENSVSGVADNPASPFRGDLHQIAELKQRFPHLKVLISLEGRAADFAVDAKPENRQAFVASCVDTFLRGHLAPGIDAGTLFDGIDIDWEYPRDEDAANYQALLNDLRQAMDSLRPGLRLSVAVGPSPRMYPGVDMAAVARTVDQIGLMNYDYNGPWQHTTGFIAPLFSDAPEGTPAGGTVERTVLAYKAAGVPPSKLLLGLPFYGYGWHQVDATDDGLHQPGQAIRGDRPYSYLQTLISKDPLTAPQPASPPPPTEAAPPATPRVTPANSTTPPDGTARIFTVHRDTRSQAPWLFDGDTFWTYEDPTSIRFKVGFAIEQGLGGVMAWELGEDAPDAALLKAARQPLQP